MRKFGKLAFAGALALATAGGAAAQTYRASTWQGDNEANSVTMRWFSEEFAKATGGAITFEVFTGGVLMPPKAHLQGVGDGVVQLGFHTSGYTPSELPMSNALSGYGYVEPDPWTIALAYTDWIMTSEPGSAEFAEHNVVPFGGFSTPLYPILCASATPITSLDQLQGKKIRFPGGATSKLAQDLGAVPVNIPAPEIYQAMQTGQIDCAGILAAWLNQDATLDEVTRSVTKLGVVGSFNSPVQIYNKDFWSSLTTDQRKTIFELAARAQAKIQIRFLETDATAYKKAADKGIVIVEPDDSIRNAIKAWVDAGVGDMAGVAKDTYGVQDPDALFASFAPYVEKWRGIMAGVGNPMDEEVMTKVIWDNIYAGLDPATYRVK